MGMRGLKGESFGVREVMWAERQESNGAGRMGGGRGSSCDKVKPKPMFTREHTAKARVEQKESFHQFATNEHEKSRSSHFQTSLRNKTEAEFLKQKSKLFNSYFLQ